MTIGSFLFTMKPTFCPRPTELRASATKLVTALIGMISEAPLS